MGVLILENCRIVTGAYDEKGALVIDGEKIADICLEKDETSGYRIEKAAQKGSVRTDLDGKIVMAGGIDLHVHFREPGLTHKADMATESAAAVIGGVTSFIDMPNTRPATTCAKALADKLQTAKGHVYANYGFHLGATNGNIGEIEQIIRDGKDGIGKNDFCGIKVFMGSSTGNMLVDDNDTLETIFRLREKPVLVHCEDEATIKANLAEATDKYGEDIPMAEHERIRSRMACIKSSIRALELAIANKTRLHLLHISTREEAEMVRAAKLQNIDITGETSANYLRFCNEDYARLGSKCKCNPSVKTAEDRDALIEALENGIIDTIGSDHAPHLETEKTGKYSQAPSGLPSIQFQIPYLLTLASEGRLSYTTIARSISERPAEIGGIANRGFMKEGYYADLIVIDPECRQTVSKADIASRCQWSPYEGETLTGKIIQTYVNGLSVMENGKVTGRPEGQKIDFI